VVIALVGFARPAQALGGLAVVLCGLPAYWWLVSRGALVRQLPNGADP
jgi:hypothetical protein